MSTNTHYDAVLARLKELMSQALPHAAEENDLEIPFLEMGANSLMLMDVQKTIESEYGLNITIGQFFEELTTINALVHYIDEQLQERDSDGEVTASGAEAGDTSGRVSDGNGFGRPAGTDNTSGGGFNGEPGNEFRPENLEESDIEAIFANQIRITSQAMNDLVARQLAFLSGRGSTPAPNSAPGQPASVQSASVKSAQTHSAPKQAGSHQSATDQATLSPATPSPAISKPSSSKPKGAVQPNKMLSPLEIRARGLSAVHRGRLRCPGLGSG